MKYLLIFALFVATLLAKASEQNWGAIALSDIHIYTKSKGDSGRMPQDFKNLLATLPGFIKENNIKFIFLLGDTTSGNKDDKFSLKSTKAWWDEIYQNFLPLQKLGVQIIPVAGNHDFYTDNHKKGFEYGSSLFFQNKAFEFSLNKKSPLYFSLNYQQADFFFLHLVDYSIDDIQLHWLKNEVNTLKDNQNEKIAFGHVPLYTRLIKTPFLKFGNKVKEVLESGHVHHYICGHEHYFWDELFGENNFRQTTMGTSSGTYNFSPNKVHYENFCSNGICEFPTGLRVQVRESDRKQTNTQMFLHLKFSQTAGYELLPMAFSKNKIIPFNLP